MAEVPSRPVRWPQDGPALLRLLGETWRDLGPRLSLHPGDLVWRALLREPGELRVWEDSRGDPIGLVELQASDPSCDIAVRPDRTGTLERTMLEWAEAEARRLGTGGTFTAGGFEGDDERHRLLTDLGYTRSEHFYPHFLRSLDEPIGDTAPADGYAIRPFRPGDVEHRIALGAAAFGSTALTVERYARLRSSPGYDPELDLVAVSPDGRPAAFALFWFDPISRCGELEPLGCHPDHHRRGLARALISEGLRRLRDRGATRAVVYTGSRNAAARALYESCGYADIGHDFDYEKPLA